MVPLITVVGPRLYLVMHHRAQMVFKTRVKLGLIAEVHVLLVLPVQMVFKTEMKPELIAAEVVRNLAIVVMVF